MNTMDIVTVTNLSKRYGDFAAVNGITFSIHRGEIFGFLGPNGAGKTTTINIMIGLARPSGGSILINGINAVKNVKWSVIKKAYTRESDKIRTRCAKW